MKPREGASPGQPHRARAMLALFTALPVLTVGVAGCTPAPPSGEAVTSSLARWECESTADEVLPEGLGPSWTQDGPSLMSVHSTTPRGSDFPGQPTREEAMAGAVASATEAALDVLDQRGIPFTQEKRLAIVDAAVGAAEARSEVTFPRIMIAGSRWRKCVRHRADEPEAGAPADTAWSADLLVEYPIGRLRGDVNNALWERGRAISEAEILLSSAEERLRDSRWTAALVERARALTVIREAGVLFPPGAPYRDEGDASVVARMDERLRLISETSDLIGAALATLTARPIQRVGVVETGTRSDAAVDFQLTYTWLGEDVPAVGVPVLFALPGAGAVLEQEPVTDDAGVARCAIEAAYGGPGEYLLSVQLDLPVVRAVDSAIARLLEGAQYHGEEHDGTSAPSALATMTVHLVAGSHATSVCAEFAGVPGDDIAQVAAGFERRMERDGFVVEGCSASVDVILTSQLTLTSLRENDQWTARVSLTASAFDQRTAADLGESQITIAQTSDEGQREAEVLALKEAGRLLAVHFSSRILLEGL